MARRTYTTKFIKEIADYIEKTHCTLAQAAVHFEVPMSTVHSKMHKLENEQGERIRAIFKENSKEGSLKGGTKTAKKIKQGTYRRVDDEKIKELVKAKKTNLEIAKETGYSVSSVKRYSRRYRGKQREIRYAELSDMEIKNLKRKYREVAKTIETGQSIKLLNSKDKKIGEGEVIQKNRDMFTLQCRAFKESFNYSDLYCREIRVVVS